MQSTRFHELRSLVGALGEPPWALAEVCEATSEGVAAWSSMAEMRHGVECLASLTRREHDLSAAIYNFGPLARTRRHGHGRFAAVEVVVAGRQRHAVWSDDHCSRSSLLVAGDSQFLEVGSMHRAGNPSLRPSLSVHLYFDPDALNVSTSVSRSATAAHHGHGVAVARIEPSHSAKPRG